MLRFIAMLTILLLAACNLQQEPPAPTTISPTETDAQAAPSPVPIDEIPSQPTLFPTPTQLTLVTATLPAAPTTVDVGGGTGGAGVATVDAAQADERYPIEARNGATLGVNYEVTIGVRGVVSMIVQGPDGLLWQRTFTASETGRAEVQIEQGGTYEVLVFRENLDGSYAVSWD